VEASGWNVDEFLRSVHWLLKDTPARREDYRKSVENEPIMPCDSAKQGGQKTFLLSNV